MRRRPQRVLVSAFRRGMAGYLRRVAKGYALEIICRGRPVAHIVPPESPVSSAVARTDRHAARGRLLARLAAQRTSNLDRWHRDELYER